MKAVVILILTLGINVTASAMGHPHNLFSAHRKAQQYKATESRSTSVPGKRVLTNCVQASAPTIVSWGWELLREKFL